MSRKPKIEVEEKNKTEVQLEETIIPEVVLPEIKEIKKTEERTQEGWNPKTSLGKKVKSGEIINIDEILDKGMKILEPQIVEKLLPNLEIELIKVGQSKGKFGGGKRYIWRQTQKKTKEGNNPKFGALVIVGNRDGYVGIGYGNAKETVPAREKAIRNAKLNVIKIRRGCGSWTCGCREPHSIPFTVKGKSGSVIMKIMPAPKGTKLCIEEETQKLLRLAGIKDVYSKAYGQTRTKLNTLYACFDALKKLSQTKVHSNFIKTSGLVEGSIVKS